MVNKVFLDFAKELHSLFGEVELTMAINCQSISPWEKRILSIELIDGEMTKISNSTNIESFNITLTQTNYTKEDTGSDDFGNTLWYKTDYIFFYEDDIIKCNLSFLSNKLSLYNLPDSLPYSEENLNEIMNLAGVYRSSSEHIFEAHNKIDKLY